MKIQLPCLILALTMALAPAAQAAGSKTIETAGTGIAIAMPIIAGGIAFEKQDRMGLAQLFAVTAMTVGTAYGLKQFVRERRPDGSDFQSFPSDTTALSASGSAFLWGRYGWRYGLPAMLATQFVSYSRVQAKQHHWYDTLASSAIAAGYSYALTTPFKRRYNVNTSLNASPDGAYLLVSYEW